MSVSPCVHPGCRDGDGNRGLTTQNMCDPCRDQFWSQLKWYVRDYWLLKAMPTPARSAIAAQVRHPGQQSFGHPAADASDGCAEIADVLNSIETQLRAHLGEGPAPNPRRSAEQWLVSHADTYLSGHFEQLCDWPDVGHHVGAIAETHQTNRRKYGYTRYVERLPFLRCPSCDVAALVRYVGSITCEECRRAVSPERYTQLSHLVGDWELDEYQAEEEAESAAANLSPP